MKWPSYFIIVALMPLAGCTLGPDYEEPETFSGVQWTASPEGADSATAVETRWWTLFSDPMLDGYIEEAVRENRNLRAAEARVRRAQALRREVAADYYPELSAEGGHTRQGVSGTTSDGSRRTVYDVGLSASWEIDLFGGGRRADEAERARVEGEIEQRRATLLSVLAEVARSYYSVRGVQKQIAITEKNIAVQQQTFELIETLFDMGEASEFDISRSRGQLQVSQSRLPLFDAEMRSSIYRLSVLLGRPPSALLEEMTRAGPLPVPPDLVPVGQTSDVLLRRPDIRAAERELAAATADIGTVTADLFPRFTLLGGIGRSGRTIDDLRLPLSNRYLFSQLISWPIFQGGMIRAQVRAEEAEVEEAVALYEQTVLEAFSDVESSLIRYLRERETRNILQEAVNSLQRSVELARGLFNSGEENFLSVLIAERELIAVELEHVRSETDSILSLITLYTSLGGGWEPFEPSLDNNGEK